MSVRTGGRTDGRASGDAGGRMEGRANGRAGDDGGRVSDSTGGEATSGRFGATKQEVTSENVLLHARVHVGASVFRYEGV